MSVGNETISIESTWLDECLVQLVYDFQKKYGENAIISEYNWGYFAQKIQALSGEYELFKKIDAKFCRERYRDLMRQFKKEDNVKLIDFVKAKRLILLKQTKAYLDGVCQVVENASSEKSKASSEQCFISESRIPEEQISNLVKFMKFSDISKVKIEPDFVPRPPEVIPKKKKKKVQKKIRGTNVLSHPQYTQALTTAFLNTYSGTGNQPAPVNQPSLGYSNQNMINLSGYNAIQRNSYLIMYMNYRRLMMQNAQHQSNVNVIANQQNRMIPIQHRNTVNLPQRSVVNINNNPFSANSSSIPLLNSPVQQTQINNNNNYSKRGREEVSGISMKLEPPQKKRKVENNLKTRTT